MPDNKMLADDITTADVIRAMPYRGSQMDYKAVLRDMAMRGRITPSPEMNQLLAEEAPRGEPNWFGRALQAIPEPVMLMANFVGPKVRLPKPRAGLDMSTEARIARSAQQKFSDEENPFYHGTTHDIREFAEPGTDRGAKAYMPDAWHGPAAYMTSSVEDATKNYAKFGPDLKNRIERLAETIDMERPPNVENAKSMAKLREIGKRADELGHLPDRYKLDAHVPGRMSGEGAAWLKAYNELMGKVPEGQVLELRHRASNPVVIDHAVGARPGRSRDTWFEYENPFWIDEKDGTFHVMEGQKRIRSHADESTAYADMDSLNDLYAARGAGPKIIDEVRRLPEGQQLGDTLYEMLMDQGGIAASQLEKAYRNSDVPLALMERGTEAGTGPDAIYRKLGHDATIMHNAENVWPGMRMPTDTTHVALFDPRKVRRTDAAFDPKRLNSRDLLAGLAGAAAIPAGITVGGSLNQMLED